MHGLGTNPFLTGLVSGAHWTKRNTTANKEILKMKCLNPDPILIAPQKKISIF